jgi:hypothetical protein
MIKTKYLNEADLIFHSSQNRSNFLRTKFTVYDAHPPHDGAVVSKRWSAGNYPVSHVYYELNVLGSRYVIKCGNASIS